MARAKALPQIAYSVTEAAAAVGYSRPIVEKAVKNGDITVHYANTKGVILTSELIKWVESLPVDKPSTS